MSAEVTTVGLDDALFAAAFDCRRRRLAAARWPISPIAPACQRNGRGRFRCKSLLNGFAARVDATVETAASGGDLTRGTACSIC